MTFQNIAVLVIVAFSWSVCHGGSEVQVFTSIKNCAPEAIYFAGAFLKYKCVFFAKPECNDNYTACITKQNFDPKKALSTCQQELGSQFMMNAPIDSCNAGPDKYLDALQTICCIKTKLDAQAPDKTPYQNEEERAKCYDKTNCPDMCDISY